MEYETGGFLYFPFVRNLILLSSKNSIESEGIVLYYFSFMNN